jgi:hypothetical protein
VFNHSILYLIRFISTSLWLRPVILIPWLQSEHLKTSLGYLILHIYNNSGYQNLFYFLFALDLVVLGIFSLVSTSILRPYPRLQNISVYSLFFSGPAAMSSHSKILCIGAVHCMKYNDRLKLDSEFFVPLWVTNQANAFLQSLRSRSLFFAYDIIWLLQLV